MTDSHSRTTPVSPGIPERGTAQWYLYKRKIQTEGTRSGRLARFRAITRHKRLTVGDTIAGRLEAVFSTEYNYFVWNVEPVLCVYCNTRLNKHSRTRDHLVPRSRGGGSRENLVPACGGCNRDKSDRSLLEWLVDR